MTYDKVTFSPALIFNIYNEFQCSLAEESLYKLTRFQDDDRFVLCLYILNIVDKHEQLILSYDCNIFM